METPPRARAAVDGNEAAARVAYALSEVIAIYPITPASTMGELSDLWASERRPNLWGAVPRVVELQSEAGAAGALHGALSAGSLATTFTASQGLLLMIPVFYKIAGELTPFVAHVASRALAAHALSIFGDHSDVMAARGTGFALLCSGSVQEAQDLALVAHAASLEVRVPFLHFFDGFRTSHEIQDIETLSDEDFRALLPEARVRQHRDRGLKPERPSLRGTAQNPDAFFQGREAANPYHDACPEAVQAAMDALAARTGRAYRLFDYAGSPDAERVLIVMGSAAGAAEEAAEVLRRRGEKVGVLRVRLYRPFSVSAFRAALPRTVKAAAVLDRVKEPGSPGEPLFLDAAAALLEPRDGEPPPLLIGGRYGLGSKEFTPAMAAAVFGELAREKPRRRFTVGIKDDVTGLSLDWDPSFEAEDPEAYRAVFFGLGSDGTVGASKAAIKLIAEKSGRHAQGYFVYDSKKSGAVTVSHLRFGPRPLRSSYLIRRARYVACHQPSLLERLDVLELCEEGGTFVLNTPDPERAWESLPERAKRRLLAKDLAFYAVDAAGVARAAGLGGRINTVMQACFFALSGALPDFLERLKDSARAEYADKGPKAVEANLRALDAAVAGLRRVVIPADACEPAPREAGEEPPEFVRRVTLPLLSGRGDELPVSAYPADGTWPTGTSRWEKRRLASEIPAWEPGLCIQCNKCALVCPHAAIRAKAYDGGALAAAPEGFQSLPWKGREFAAGTRYTIQTAPEDCTGCRLCVEVCPAESREGPPRKALAMAGIGPRLEPERRAWEYFLSLRDATPIQDAPVNAKLSQLRCPLFEFPGACAGCGESPYLKLLSQLFGERLVIANATGCSSIFGGNLPTTPWTTGAGGRGPAWSNSLFEDNAEFGLGLRLAFRAQRELAARLLTQRRGAIGATLVDGLLGPEDPGDRGRREQAERLKLLRAYLSGVDAAWARDLEALAGSLERRSVWMVGGDGWAYDIGFGGLEHVLRSGEDVKALVLDTEVYSNTGGQASKATPRGAEAKFAAGGKSAPRKDLVLETIVAGGAYVARVALGADAAQTVSALQEAEAYPGPALVVAYSPCIAHGIEMSEGLAQQKRAVDSGYWPLLRFDPGRKSRGQPPLKLDSREPRLPFRDYALREGRYRRLLAEHPEEAERLLALAEQDLKDRWALLGKLAAP